MLTVTEAHQRIRERVSTLAAETISLGDGLGRVLAKTVTAPASLPRWDNSAMDGFAVRAGDTPGSLPICQEIAAGKVAGEALLAGAAARILTGAPVPTGADAVEMQENVEVDEDRATFSKAVAVGANIRRAGEDIEAGQEALPAGTVLGPGELALLGALGVADIAVIRRPVVAVLPTGDELVELGQPLQRGQIYNSNAIALAGQVREAGAIAKVFAPVRDGLAETEAKFAEAMSADVVVSCGGVSVGDKDFVQDALRNIGAEIHFWKVAMKPGKPLVFAGKEKTLIFGLPGNPVSAMVTFELFVRPTLLALQGRTETERPQVPVKLSDAYKKRSGRTHFLPAQVTRDGEELSAQLRNRHSSGMVTSMARVDALVEIAADSSGEAAGSTHPARLLRAL